MSTTKFSGNTTHAAVAVVGTGEPLQIIQVPSLKPAAGQVRVEVHWTASAPFDLHQAHAGIFSTPPHVLGDTATGVVVEVGEGVEHLRIGDTVSCALVPADEERAQQEFITVGVHVVGKIPDNVEPEAAAAVPSSFITSWHALASYLSIPLPFPKPVDHIPADADEPILIWGASSSCGQYAVQIMKHYGYTNILITASKKHHETLRSFGAAKTFDYNSSENIQQLGDLLESEALQGKTIKVLDCIASEEGSMEPLAKIVPPGSLVAVLIPVLKKHASPDDIPVPGYGFESQDVVPWKEGVTTLDVKTHYYQQNEYLKNNLQPIIIPAMLAQGVITPNKVRIVEGRTLLERAQNALDILRRREVSGEKLVWRVKQA